MQFDRSADGTLTPLPKPSVDTGAGLERIASVLQGSDDNFHTDLFRPLLDQVSELVGAPYPGTPDGPGASYRVLADHARAVAFLLADGVYPSNEGRGYVLRRILRRAVRHAWVLGRREPTLTALIPTVVRLMGEAYPELVVKGDFLREVTETEERRFLETIEGGLARLEELFAARRPDDRGRGGLPALRHLRVPHRPHPDDRGGAGSRGGRGGVRSRAGTAADPVENGAEGRRRGGTGGAGAQGRMALGAARAPEIRRVRGHCGGLGGAGLPCGGGAGRPPAPAQSVLRRIGRPGQ